MDAQVFETLLSPWTLAVLGLCIGSFLNVVIHRLPLMLERGWKLDSADMLGVKVDVPSEITLSTPRSRCPSCGHAIAWHENIPVLSYLWLGGKCSACKTRISARYPFFEIATAALFAAIAWRFGAQASTLAWCAFAATLVALAGIDWDTTLLPDSLTSIGEGAFGFNPELTQVRFTGPAPATITGADQQYPSLGTAAGLTVAFHARHQGQTPQQGFTTPEWHGYTAMPAYAGKRLFIRAGGRPAWPYRSDSIAYLKGIDARRDEE